MIYFPDIDILVEIYKKKKEGGKCSGFWDHCDQFTFPRNNKKPGPCRALPELRQEAREITNVRFCGEQNRIKFYFFHYTLSFLCTLLKFRLGETSLGQRWKHLNLMYYHVKKLRQNDLLSRHGYFSGNLQEKQEWNNFSGFWDQNYSIRSECNGDFAP